MTIPFSAPLSVTRYDPGAYDSNGLWVDGSTSVLSVNASVQPVTPRARQAIEDEIQREGGSHLVGLLVVYSDQELKGDYKNTGEIGDRFTVQGQTFEVIKRSHWNGGIISDSPKITLGHWQCYAALVDEKTL